MAEETPARAPTAIDWSVCLHTAHLQALVVACVNDGPWWAVVGEKCSEGVGLLSLGLCWGGV